MPSSWSESTASPAANTAVFSKAKILAIGISVRAMAESAVNSGFAIVALDAFADRDLKALTECHALKPYSPRALLDSSRGLDFESVAYTSNLENYPEILERFARVSLLIGNSPETVRAVRNWPDLFSRLRAGGFTVPDTLFSPVGHSVPGQHWLCKPVLSGGGHGICFKREGNLKLQEGTMLQRYIRGKACSASFVGNGRDAVLLGVSEQLIGLRQFGARRFRYCGSIVPAPEMLEPGSDITAQARETAQFLVREYGLRGVNGFDFVFDGRKLWITEVNPRYSASMELIESAYGVRVFQIHVEASIRGRLPDFDLESRLSGRMFHGKCILFCEKDCTVPEEFDCPGLSLRDIPASGEHVKNGSPVCTILASRPAYGETLAELNLRAAKIKEQLYG